LGGPGAPDPPPASLGPFGPGARPEPRVIGPPVPGPSRGTGAGGPPPLKGALGTAPRGHPVDSRPRPNPSWVPHGRRACAPEASASPPAPTALAGAQGAGGAGDRRIRRSEGRRAGREKRWIWGRLLGSPPAEPSWRPGGRRSPFPSGGGSRGGTVLPDRRPPRRPVRRPSVGTWPGRQALARRRRRPRGPSGRGRGDVWGDVPAWGVPSEPPRRRYRMGRSPPRGLPPDVGAWTFVKGLRGLPPTVRVWAVGGGGCRREGPRVRFPGGGAATPRPSVAVGVPPVARGGRPRRRGGTVPRRASAARGARGKDRWLFHSQERKDDGMKCQARS